jgi:hypothetical protein
MDMTEAERKGGELGACRSASPSAPPATPGPLPVMALGVGSRSRGADAEPLAPAFAPNVSLLPLASTNRLPMEAPRMALGNAPGRDSGAAEARAPSKPACRLRRRSPWLPRPIPWPPDEEEEEDVRMPDRDRVALVLEPGRASGLAVLASSPCTGADMLTSRGDGRAVGEEEAEAAPKRPSLSSPPTAAKSAACDTDDMAEYWRPSRASSRPGRPGSPEPSVIE